MIAEIAAVGFSCVELGYDLTAVQAEGVRRAVRQAQVRVLSVHNFCPVPPGAPYGHPEWFCLCSPQDFARRNAVRHTLQTVAFAREMGAETVVAHAGNVRMRHLTRKLLRLHARGRQYGARYEKIKLKLFLKRERKAAPYFDALCRSFEELLPTLADCRIRLAIENLPSWESVPTELEMETLLARFTSPWLGYWHDTGHGQVRQNLGFIGHLRWLERLAPHTAGLHIHDVIPPATDHLAPSRGALDFALFKPFIRSTMPMIMEPAPQTPVEDLRLGLQHLKTVWELDI